MWDGFEVMGWYMAGCVQYPPTQMMLAHPGQLMYIQHYPQVKLYHLKTNVLHNGFLSLSEQYVHQFWKLHADIMPNIVHPTCMGRFVIKGLTNQFLCIKIYIFFWLHIIWKRINHHSKLTLVWHMGGKKCSNGLWLDFLCSLWIEILESTTDPRWMLTGDDTGTASTSTSSSRSTSSSSTLSAKSAAKAPQWVLLTFPVTWCKMTWVFWNCLRALHHGLGNWYGLSRCRHPRHAL